MIHASNHTVQALAPIRAIAQLPWGFAPDPTTRRVAGVADELQPHFEGAEAKRRQGAESSATLSFRLRAAPTP